MKGAVGLELCPKVNIKVKSVHSVHFGNLVYIGGERGVKFMLAYTENATDVRNKWSDFVDSVTIDQKPRVVSRNNKNPFLSISLEQVSTLLYAYRFNVITKYYQDDGMYIVELEDFDLFAQAATREEAIDNLAEELIEYATEYVDEIELYYAAPNRKKHLPYVLSVLLQDDKDNVIKLLNANL